MTSPRGALGAGVREEAVAAALPVAAALTAATLANVLVVSVVGLVLGIGIATLVRRKARGWFREVAFVFIAAGAAYPFALAPFSIATASLAFAAGLGLLVWRALDSADRIPGRRWGAGLVWPSLGGVVSLSAVLFLPPVGLRYGLVAVLLVAALVLAAYQISKIPSVVEIGPPD